MYAMKLREMKPVDIALIIRKPHINNLLNGTKVWEMRSTKTSIRGRIGLIEAGSGLIVGEANLVDCLPALEDEIEAAFNLDKHQVRDLSLLKKWKFPWVIEGANRYDDPIPYDHPRGAVIWVKRFPDNNL